MKQKQPIWKHAFLRATFFTTAFRFGLSHSLIRIRSLILLVYYADPRGKKQIGFVDWPDRPARPRREGLLASSAPTPPTPPPAPPSPTSKPKSDSTDVCVIGSGAGGAVVAARLAEAGFTVVIIEEGPWLEGEQITGDLLAMQSAAYRDGGVRDRLDFV